jgi:nucleoside-diphosphate-sugar epimerase
VPIRDVAEVIGRHLGLPVVSISPKTRAMHFAWMAGFLGADSPASSAFTRELLGWHPTQPGLIADLEEAHYFQQARTAAA